MVPAVVVVWDKRMEISDKKNLANIFSDIIEFDVPLSKLSQWKVGGVADVIIRPTSKAELIAVQQWLHANQLPSLIIGNTTNLLFSDEGLHTAVIQMASNFSNVKIEDAKIIAESGVWVPSLAKMAMRANLSGLEHTCGIPGTLGGLIVMNGGSQRQSIGRVVSYVETVDYEGHIHHYSNEECRFAYRHSIFQHRKEVIVEVGLVLDKETDKSDIQKKMIEILSARRKKFPRKQPSCGSVFVSNPDMYDSYGPPGQIIESLGFKGMCRGDAQVSHRHANFIVNNGQATSEDILFLINIIKKSVYDKTGYQMAVEAKLITPYGEIKSI